MADTRTMFHATPAENIESIEERGLDARPLATPVREQTQESIYDHATGRVEQDAEFVTHTDGVYLCKTRESAERYCDHLAVEHFWDDEAHEFVVLEVEVEREKVFRDSELVHDEDCITASGRVFVESIGPECIESTETVTAGGR